MKVAGAFLLAVATVTGCRDATRPTARPPQPQFSVVTAFSVQDLGVLASHSYAVGINNQGEVAITGDVAIEVPGGHLFPDHPLRWTATTGLVDLGTLGGMEGVAFGINDLGQVVGWALTTAGPSHAFLWSPAAGMTDLGTLSGFSGSEANAINNVGQVVGFSSNGEPESIHAFVWSSSTGMVDLGTLGGTWSAAWGVNDLGQVVGVAAVGSGVGHAFFWTPTGGMVDLGTLGGPSSFAADINDLGQVVGNAQTASGDTHAFLWTPGAGMVDLGTLRGTSSYALSINDLSQVVGAAALTSGPYDTHAFIWTAEGGLVDLGTLGGSTSKAWSINDRGQVAGSSTSASGFLHAALWTVELTPPTPTENLAILQAGVDNAAASGAINGGQHTALLAKLDAATRALNRGNTHAAINILRAFVNQVQAFVDAGTVTPAEGQRLIDAAERVIAALGG